MTEHVPVPLNPHGVTVPSDRITHKLDYYTDKTPPPGTIMWKAEWCVEKYEDTPSAAVRAGVATPTEVRHVMGNVLTYGGGDILWLGAKNGLTATTGAANTFFDNSNAAIIVGSSGAAAVASDTDLSASTDTDREAAGMEATYPTHTTGNNSTANLDISFRSVFSTAIANFAWEEWGITNTTKSSAPLAGRLLNRKAEALGTKTSAATWTFTCKLSLS